MAKKKKSKTQQPAVSTKAPAAESVVAVSPYLPTAHPPAQSPTLLAVSVILFVVWFLFLLLAALAG